MKGRPRITVLDAGMGLSVQDLGRLGFGSSGVSRSGTADRMSLRAGNRMIGNTDTAAALEGTLLGFAVRFETAARVAVTGATAQVTVTRAGESRPIPLWRPVAVPAETVVRVGRATRGARTVLTIAGGIDVPAVLGSRSEHRASGLGLVFGRPLAPGDELPLGKGVASDRPTRVEADADHARRSNLLRLIRSRFRRTLRVVVGPQAPALGPAAIERFTSQPWRVDPRSDRVGVRLAGDPLPIADAGHMPSEASLPGFVQVTPDGTAIILGPDAGPTGGYPVLAAVISADLDALGQLAPGDAASFRAVGLDEARLAAAEQETWLEQALPQPVPTASGDPR